MRVEQAKREHIKDIYAISSAFDISKGNQSERGFLVSSYSLEQYEQFFADPLKHLYVVLEENVVIGFLYGYFVKDGEPSISLEAFKVMASLNDFIVKQICVSPTSPKGTGTFLMNTLFDIINQDIYLAIVSDPLNVSSLLFHKKCGFIEFNRVLEADGMRRILMVRYHQQNHEKFIDSNLEQYKAAIDLYKHEDGLTWTKFNFSVITNGAILSILLPNVSSTFNRPLFLFLIIAVIVINCGYIYTIHMGRKYLRKRKDNAIRLERKLQFTGINYIIHDVPNQPHVDVIDSNTKYVQYLIPTVFILGWITILIVFLV